MKIKFYRAHSYFYYNKKKYSLNELRQLVLNSEETPTIINHRTKEDISASILTALLYPVVNNDCLDEIIVLLNKVRKSK
jgi:hypothetical protein